MVPEMAIQVSQEESLVAMSDAAQTGTMLVGLNLLQARPEIGGAWYALKNLLAALARYASDSFRFIAYCTEKSAPLVPEQSERIAVTYPRQRNGWSIPERLWREHIWLPGRAVKDRVDVMHWFGNYASPFSPVPALVMVHDLQAFRNQSALSFPQRAYLKRMMRGAARSSRVLLAPISHAVADELVNVLHVSQEKLLVLEHIVPENFRRIENTSEFVQRYGLPERFWLYVAHPYPHKNHQRLLEAHAMLEKTGRKPWPMVFCGRPLSSDSMRSAVETGSVRQLTGIPDEDMPFLYSAASGLVFPSLYEGCGLPLLEAQACGCRLAVSDIAAAREFAGGDAFFFDPYDIDSIAEAMLGVQEQCAAEMLCVETVFCCADRFRPVNVCSNTLRVYELIAHQS